MIKSNRHTNKQIVRLALLFIISVGIYANTFTHDYAMDDAIVITANSFTMHGIEGIDDIFSNVYLAGLYRNEMTMYSGGRYRPLSIVTFAVEYQFFGQNPHISHIVNVLLYSLSCLLLYYVLQLLFRNIKTFVFGSNFFNIPFLITVLFAAHPIHTEIVANIKGRDEILALFGSLAAWFYILKYFDNRKIKYAIVAFFLYFLGLLSKETAICFTILIPLSVYYFRQCTIVEILKISPPVFVAALVFIIIRISVVGSPVANVAENLMTNPFLEATSLQRFATIAFSLGLYIKLLFFPHPLTFDYYPYHITLMNFTDFSVIVSCVAYLFLIIIAIKGFVQKSIFSFSILFYLTFTALFSNILFNIGVFMSERFLYVSSLGFCIFVVWFVFRIIPELFEGRNMKYIRRYKYFVATLFITVFVSYSIKAFSRNFDWKDNYTLFTTDVKTSGNSLKSTAAAGEMYLSKARRETDTLAKKKYYSQAIDYFTKTIEIYPNYVNVLVYLGEAHLEFNLNIEAAMVYFHRVLAIYPQYPKVYDDVLRLVDVVSDVDERISILESLLKYKPNRFEVYSELGTYYGAYKNDLQQSIKYLIIANSKNPNDIKTLSDLGVAYAMSGNLDEAIRFFEQVVANDPENRTIIENLIAAYNLMQNIEMENKYKVKLQKIISSN